jgi:hypothetical protein
MIAWNGIRHGSGHKKGPAMRGTNRGTIKKIKSANKTIVGESLAVVADWSHSMTIVERTRDSCGRNYPILTNLKPGRALHRRWLMTGNASAVTAEVAKNCAALTAKVFPPRVPRNPAAGSAKGTAQSKQSYFNKCLENEGNWMNYAQAK